MELRDILQAVEPVVEGAGEVAVEADLHSDQVVDRIEEAVTIRVRQKETLDMHHGAGITISCLTRTIDDGSRIDMGAADTTRTGGSGMTSGGIEVAVGKSIETRDALTDGRTGDGLVRGVHIMRAIEKGRERGEIVIGDRFVRFDNGMSAMANTEQKKHIHRIIEKERVSLGSTCTTFVGIYYNRRAATMGGAASDTN